MKFLNRMERKFGKYAVHDLMKYILGLYVVGSVLGLLNAEIYNRYLSLDLQAIMKGQIWRLITFIMAPSGSLSSSGILGVLFLVIEVYLYHMIGSALEQAWGAFRFNMYMYSGILFNVIAGIILQVVITNTQGIHVVVSFGLVYIFQSMFFAFAFLYPNVQLMLWMIIPVKVKWLGYLYGVIFAVEVLACFVTNDTLSRARGVAMIVATANFVLFALWSWKDKRPSMAQVKRRREFKKQVRTMADRAGEPRHRCAICGRTEQDNPDLEFRFCSKCEGNYEYCSDHLFTHEHVKR